MTIPYVVSEAVWAAKEASETYALKSDFEKCQVVVVEIATAGFSGTLDIQGKLHELAGFANLPYIRQDQAVIQVPSVSQISLTTDTGTYRYAVLGFWRQFRLVMARTAGTITCGVVGSSAAIVFPYIPTGLASIGGSAQSGADWTLLLQHLNVDLSTRSAEATLAAVRDRINEQSAVLAFTTAILAAGASFTGIAFSVSGWGRIVVSCYADVAGTLRVEQRNDGTNWDTRSEFTYAAAALLGYSVDVVGSEARIVYVNGATAQVAFRLYCRGRRI